MNSVFVSGSLPDSLCSTVTKSDDLGNRPHVTTCQILTSLVDHITYLVTDLRKHRNPFDVWRTWILRKNQSTYEDSFGYKGLRS